MAKAKKNNTEQKLIDNIIQGIEDMKGTDIVLMNLDGISNSICSHYVICTGNSSTQVESIADSVIEEVRKKSKMKPWHVEGYENKQWILIDYIDVVVHVFQPEIRDFYAIEELWGDAQVTYPKTVTT
ncbi:MAG: ribosome silencing factor [Candidatus Competibacteraceae bacterium]|nr:ribosome silencing factor [Candidatus Competibacteraceae bacterium]